MKYKYRADEKLMRSLIYQHLKTVAPSLAVEFQDRHCCSLEPAPKHQVEEIQKKLLAIATIRRIRKGEDDEMVRQDQNDNRKTNALTTEAQMGKQEPYNNLNRLGRKVATYSKEELVRIEKAMANEEDLREVAKEMGRSYKSVHSKILNLRRVAGLKKGKFSAEEVERIEQAMRNNEDYKSVARELDRDYSNVYNRMFMMKGNSLRKAKSFTFEEDLQILQKIIARLKFQNLSSAGFLSKSELFELGEELQRNGNSVSAHWERTLQPWLLQHYTGTTGFRIKQMLTRLVAEKFNDHRGIDWSEIVSQHKEFVGHTGSSISHIFRNIQTRAKRRRNDISLQEVAEFAAAAYQPGKERKDPAAKVVHREKIILYFKERVAEQGINVVV